MTPRKPISAKKPKSPEYRAWFNMISRCENPNTPGWHRYGGRGISICARWRASSESFLRDMGPRPSVNHSLDRINSDGNYEPGNCRWATTREQTRNKSDNRLVAFGVGLVPLVDAVEQLGLKYNTVLIRLRRGKSVEDALR